MKTQDIIIKNGSIVKENSVVSADIWIKDGKIFKLARSISTAKLERSIIIDAAGKYIFPGALDPHTHHELNLGPGRMSSDTFATGSAAALNGGVTTIFDFAHQELPGETLLQAYRRVSKSARSANNRVFLHSGIMRLTDDLEKQISDVFKAGAHSFKIYLNSKTVNSEFLFRAFRAIAKLGGKILLHCEDGAIIEFLKKELHSQKKRSCKYIPESRPAYLELHSIITAATLAKNLNAEIYIVHLSTGAGAKFIEAAQQSGVKINAETCPQYLLLDDSVYKRKDGYLYTCTPPFRKKTDCEILWKYLDKEIIKFIATDHCPFLKAQKLKFSDSFINYVYGLPGIEFSPILMISEMRKRKFDYPKISRLLSTNAAKFFGLYPELGVIKERSFADLFIYNPAGEYKLSKKNWKINSDINQFENRKVSGHIETVIFNGRIIR